MEIIFFLLLLFASIIALGYGYERSNPILFYFGATLLIISGLFITGFGIDKLDGTTVSCSIPGCTLNDSNSINTTYNYTVLTTENNSFVWSLSLILPAFGICCLGYYLWKSLQSKPDQELEED